MWGNPANGHILASGFLPNIGFALIDIDPLANGGNGSFRVVTTNVFFINGVTGSPDGTIVYYVDVPFYSIIGFNIATGLQVFDSGSLSSAGLGSAADSAVISSNNSLNGDFVINFMGNDVLKAGVALLDPSTLKLTVIATTSANGGSGDYVSPD